MILKALKSRSSYKSTARWYDAIYRHNKAFIDSKLIGDYQDEYDRPIPKSVVFKELIKQRTDEGLTPNQAVKVLSKSTIFTSERERLRENAFKALKEDKAAYKEFRLLTGWKEKIDIEKLSYDKEQKIYIYNNTVGISFTNSPYSVNVIKL